MRPGPTQLEIGRNDSGAARPRWRIAQMDLRHDLAVNAIGWSTGAAPLFQQDLWEEESRRGVVSFVAIRPPRNPVAIHRDDVVGYMQLKVAKSFIAIQRLTVAPECRRRGVGLELICELLANHHRTCRRIVARVEETNLGAQLFLKRCKFEGKSDRGEIRFNLELPAGGY